MSTVSSIYYCIVCHEGKKADQYDEDPNNESTGLERTCKQCKADAAADQQDGQEDPAPVYDLTAITGLGFQAVSFDQDTNQITGQAFWDAKDPAPGMGYGYSLFNLDESAPAGTSGVFHPFTTWTYLKPSTNYRLRVHAILNMATEGANGELLFTTPGGLELQTE